MKFNALLIVGTALPGISVADGVVRQRANFLRRAVTNSTAIASATDVSSISVSLPTGSETISIPTSISISSPSVVPTSTPAVTTVISGVTTVITPTATGASASSGETSSTATTSGAAATSSVDLSSAQLSNAHIITFDGKPAVLVEAPANGQATITVEATTPATSPGEGVAVSLDVTTMSNTKRRRTVADDCTMAVVLAGVTVYNSTLVYNGGATTPITTNAIPIIGNATLQVVEKCGNNPVQAVVSNVLLVAAPLLPSTSSAYPTTLSTGTTTSMPESTGSYSETVTGTSETGTATATGNSTMTGSSTSTAYPTSSSTPGFPSVIGDFVFYGCVGSTDNFPTFYLGGSSPTMDLETCASTCANSTFAGVFETDCYCGSAVNGTFTAKVPTSECDLPCPGDLDEFCGGNRPVPYLGRRQALIPNTILLTVYINVDLVGPASTSTVSTTITSLVTTTVATTVTDATATQVQTVTTTYPTSVATVISCVGAFCGSTFIFNEYPGSECTGEVVFVQQPCSCEGGMTYQPILCTGNACVGITVFKPAVCASATCNGSTCFQPQACTSCPGGVSFAAASAAASSSSSSSSSGSSSAAAAAAAAGAGSSSSGSSASAAAAAAAGAGSSNSGSSAGSSSAAAAAAAAAAGAGSSSSPAVVTAGSARLGATLGWIAPALVAFAFLY